MATVNTPVLDLTVIEPVVRINGDDYPLRVREDLTLVTNADLAKKFARIDALRVKGKRTIKEETELGELLEQSCGAILKAPASLLEKLTQFQRFHVVQAFFQSVAVTGRKAAPAAVRSTSKK